MECKWWLSHQLEWSMQCRMQGRGSRTFVQAQHWFIYRWGWLFGFQELLQMLLRDLETASSLKELTKPILSHILG
jgi:hypothetical protein